MLQGDRLRLRTILPHDLDDLFARMNALDVRGPWFPLGLQAEPTFRRRYQENGFWGEDEGMLVMVDEGDVVVGEIEFYPITDYLTGFELSYLVFGHQHRGKGYATEAVRLLSEYLFARKRIDRVQLNIHPANEPSRRVAEKAGFTLEGVMRGCWFNRGRFHDLEIWSILRAEFERG